MDINFNTNGIMPDLTQTICSYCESFVLIHGKNLLSVVVYGSAVNQNYIPGVSNINIAMVFHHINMETLQLSLKAVKEGKKKKIIPPLFLSIDYIKNSLDTFPVEFLEIIENHRTIYGSEIFDSLKVPREWIRCECEQQVKSRLVRMRQVYLEHGPSNTILKPLIKQTFNGLIPVFRNILRLYREQLPESHKEIIIKMNSLNLFDGQVFLDLLQDKRQIDKVRWKESEFIFKELIKQLETLAYNLDQFKVQGTGND